MSSTTLAHKRNLLAFKCFSGGRGAAHMGWLGNEYYRRRQGDEEMEEQQHRCRGPKSMLHKPKLVYAYLKAPKKTKKRTKGAVGGGQRVRARAAHSPPLCFQ